MDDDTIWHLFTPLYADINEADQFYNKVPLLAHYTSMAALENILTRNEVWFSNPLFMNDVEEVKFGILEGASSLRESVAIKAALQSQERHEIFGKSLDHHIQYYEDKYLLDTYVFCLSEHNPEKDDGVLSMWRGYGGDGKGVAIVFDTSKLNLNSDSPFVIAKVHYGSSEERLFWFEEIALVFAGVLTKNHISDDKIELATSALFERLKLFALFTKHHGFEEEKEWRVVYFKERDTDDKLKSMRNFVNGPRGVEPKLRFKVAPIEGLTDPDLSIEKIISSILLGPRTSSRLAFCSVERMLEVIGKPELKGRLVSSSIPLRPT